MHKSIYMVQRADSAEYDETTKEEADLMLSMGLITLEGVDGDEEKNTVTYWFLRPEEC